MDMPLDAKWEKDGLYYKIGLHGRLYYWNNGWKVSSREDRPNDYDLIKKPEKRKKRVTRAKGETHGDILDALSIKPMTSYELRKHIGRDVSRTLSRMKKMEVIKVIGCEMSGVRCKSSVYALAEAA